MRPHPAMKHIILLRHGQSQWNLENRFTGWTDVPLSPLGRDEARRAGRLIADAGLKPQYYFTSYLSRAIDTLQIAAAEMQREYIPVIKDWHLNERHYGALQGLNKAETAERYGDDQVRLWRREYETEPPMLTPDDPRWPGREERYNALPADLLPAGESLKTTIARVGACWQEVIAPRLEHLDTVLIAAHGNSLRALAMILLKLTPQQVLDLEIPTGSPWVFETDDRLTVQRTYYLDPHLKHT